MSTSKVEIRNLHSIPEQLAAVAIFDEIWPIEGGGTEITPNFMQALVHNGCYLAGAFLDADEVGHPAGESEVRGKMVGAAFGFIGMEGGFHLHSHMAGVLDGYRDLNIGTELKLHQYQWALEKGLSHITWTFDPLVKRNARLNLIKLGVEITDYFPDFYGEMIDGHNAGDKSDRLMARWQVTQSAPRPGSEVEELPAGAISIEVPEDIAALRRSDLNATLSWRMKVRREFLEAFDAGYRVTGFSQRFGYVLSGGGKK